MDTDKTVVIFRRWPKAEGGSVLALFPEEAATRNGGCNSYEHVGQHGGADYAGCIRRTTAADISEPDVAALARELESIGYRLDIRKRATAAMARTRWQAALA